jgi:hypothetical protein
MVDSCHNYIGNLQENLSRRWVELEGCIAFAGVGMSLSLHPVDQSLIADHGLTKIPKGMPLRRTEKLKVEIMRLDSTQNMG